MRFNALAYEDKLKNTPGISGMHIMAVHWEDIVPRLIDESGVPRPAITSLAQASNGKEPAQEKPAVPST